jgi:histidinol-phosphate phosphatase family protein
VASRTSLKQLIILAGGKGTRLASELGAMTPKPMAPVAGRPLLEHQLETAKRYGFTDVRLLTSYRSEVIEEHFGDGTRFGLQVRYHVDAEPRGTAGAVLDALPDLAERFALLYGDTVLDVDLDRFWRRHMEVGADSSLFIHPNDHPQDSDLVEVDGSGWISAFHAHPHPAGRYFKNMVNAALYIIEKSALEPWAGTSGKLDFAHDLFPRMLSSGSRLYGYHSREYIKDMGTPDRLARVEADLASGLVERRSLRNLCPAVFLDRDGTINVEVNRVSSADQLELIDGAGEAVRRLNRSGRLAVVITNQPVLARGDCTEVELDHIHNKLETLLGEDGAFLDGLYFCPHHPDAGFSGERTELKIACDCRKPGTAMIERATAELGIERGSAWMIGDTTTDMQTARNAGIRSVLVRTGHAGEDRRWPVRPDYEFFDLADAAEFIVENHAPMLEEARSVLPPCVPGSLLAIGGLSRSGKGTWASLFREVLSERGQRAVVLPLDTWLHSEADRESGHVMRRFDVDAIAALSERLAGRTSSLEVQLGHYERLTRKRDEAGETVRIEPSDVIVFEGVPALAIAPLVAASSSTFYVECPETVRRDRFEREQRLRGAAPAEIEALYREREADEHPFVKVGASVADVRLGGLS